MKKACLYLIIFLSGFSSYAQRDSQEDKGIIWSLTHGLEYRLKAGFNIGGTAPLPLPVEIRKIKGFAPALALSLEGNIIKWFHPKWGVILAVKLEDKGMHTKARVKNYKMVMDARNDDGTTQHLDGVWTGNVKTNVKNSYVTIPLMATYRISKRWEIKAGPYISFLTNGSFKGRAYEGYIREGDPTGQKIEVEFATYDFSRDIRKINWGANIGGEWKAYKHFNIYTDLAWAFNSIFKKGFTSIAFDMYNIYASVGFGYVF